MLLEDDRLHVRQVDDGVDDGEWVFGNSLATLSRASARQKPTPMIGLAALGELAQRLLALRLGSGSRSRGRRCRSPS